MSGSTWMYFHEQLVGLLANAVVGACYKPYDSEVAASSDVASSFGFTVTFSSLNPRVLTIEAMVLFLVSNAESHSSEFCRRIPHGLN